MGITEGLTAGSMVLTGHIFHKHTLGDTDSVPPAATLAGTWRGCLQPAGQVDEALRMRILSEAEGSWTFKRTNSSRQQTARSVPGSSGQRPAHSTHWCLVLPPGTGAGPPADHGDPESIHPRHRCPHPNVVSVIFGLEKAQFITPQKQIVLLPPTDIAKFEKQPFRKRCS